MKRSVFSRKTCVRIGNTKSTQHCIPNRGLHTGQMANTGSDFPTSGGSRSITRRVASKPLGTNVFYHLLNWLPACLHAPTLTRSWANQISYDRRSGLTRQPEPNAGTGASMNQQRSNGSPNPSPTGYSQPPMPPLTQSASYSSQAGPNSDNGSNIAEKQVKTDSKYFFQPKFSKLGVRGNFMPLAAQPANGDIADWLAHQSRWNSVYPFRCSC